MLLVSMLLVSQEPEAATLLLLSRTVRAKLPTQMLLPPRRREDKVRLLLLLKGPMLPPSSRAQRVKRLRQPTLLRSKADRLKLPTQVPPLLLRREPKARLQHREPMLLLLKVLRPRRSRAREPPQLRIKVIAMLENLEITCSHL